MNPYTLPDTELERLLHEDTPQGDATTFALGIGARPARMVFRARDPMTVCGSEEAAAMGRLRGLRVDLHAPSGTRAAPREPLVSFTGPAAGIHAVWKSAQTLMEYLSGIATGAAELVAAARAGHPDCAVVCTRKSFPGTKAASVKAVLAGGAGAHRLSLSETLLVFEEHRRLVDAAPADCVARLRRRWPERPVVVEVADHAEALRWIAAGADVIQLEKWSVAAVAGLRAALREHPHPPRLAAAGGIHAGNAADYARAGADLLVTSAPYFAPPRDVAVSITRDSGADP
ncbi:ModD protein [Nitrogeniibacter mangrovi]|uniref:Putative pyrophosphorylase ModD n=1 Tax=Nitrogeniibacter mangrovi TaxID=2016596 RepID=A0A6C1B9Y5_9RHOO|nr:ModD protein [Nitrogeniibacter mangrovi]QID19498.1 ModD protein [Nitrogeniibacter mangrovi]